MNTFYVVPETGGGTPAGDGSSGDPWNGLANVLYNGVAGVEVNAGDILVLVGNFSDEILTIGVSGSSASVPVTVDFTQATLTHTSNYCITTNNRNYIVFNNGTIGGAVNTQNADVFISNSDGIVFNNVTFEKSGNGGSNVGVRVQMTATGDTNDLEFNSCTFKNRILIPHLALHTSILNGIKVDSCIFTGKEAYIQNLHTDKVYSLVTNSYRDLNWQVTNNSFLGTQCPAIFPTGIGSLTGVVCNITNNRLIDCNKDNSVSSVNCVQVSMAYNTVFEENTIDGNGSGGAGDGHCIILDYVIDGATNYPCINCIVRRNYCRTSLTSEAPNRCGISLWNAQDCEIYANVCEDNPYGMRISNTESTGNAVYGNELKNNSIAGYQMTFSSPLSVFTGNVVSGGVSGIDADAGTTLPTETYNIYYDHSGNVIDNNGTPVAVDSTSTEATVYPLDSNHISIEGGDADATGARWWTGANPQGFNGEPFSDFDTDIGPNQSTRGPFHPKNI